MTVIAIKNNEKFRHLRPNLPTKLLEGYESTTNLEDSLRDRETDMWEPGQTQIGSYFLPPFQRPEVWTTEQKVRLVESFLLGISIGSIVVVDALNMPMQSPNMFARTDRWLLDGQQRLSALRDYQEDRLTVFAGTECEHRWSNLTEIEIRHIKSFSFGKIRVHTTSEELCREIYNRLNFCGTAHSENQMA